MNSAAELLASLPGCDPDEGIVIAYFPCEVKDHYLLPELTMNWAPGQQAAPVCSDLGPWKERLLDIAVTLDSKELLSVEPEVTWGDVREAARELKLNEVPIRWHGPLSEVPYEYFEPKPGVWVGFRFYNHGPWFFPLEPAPKESE
jgi:hypothetical protein